jgi:hypothetical protein
MEQFTYFETKKLTNQNSIHKEIKNRTKSGNACCHQVQNILTSSLLSKNIKTQIYRTVILPVVLYGREGWSLTLREEHRLQVFENRVIRKISGPKDRVTGSEEDYLTRSFMLCTPHQLSVR